MGNPPFVRPTPKNFIVQVSHCNLFYCMVSSAKMQRHAMDWDDLQVVLAIGFGGTSSAAGRRMRMSQTIAGRRLKRLERRLGPALFVRGRFK